MTGHARRDAHNSSQIAYFANTYKKTMQPRTTAYVERHVEEFIRHTRLQTDWHILEVGCGIGKYTFPLLERGFRIEGLDLTPELLDQLRGYLPGGARASYAVGLESVGAVADQGGGRRVVARRTVIPIDADPEWLRW